MPSWTPRRASRLVAPIGAALVAFGVVACDPTVTDPSYWERAPSASVASTTSGDGDGDGDPSGGGGAAASGAAPSSGDSSATGTASPNCASIAFITASYGGEYDPENVGAVWVTDASGAFVRTLERWGSQRLKNAVAWRASSNGNDVDAITGATRDEHGRHDLVWDCRDADGGVRDGGGFQLHAELTEDDSAEGEPPGPHLVLPFDLAIAGPLVTPVDATFTDLRVVVRP